MEDILRRNHSNEIALAELSRRTVCSPEFYKVKLGLSPRIFTDFCYLESEIYSVTSSNVETDNPSIKISNQDEDKVQQHSSLRILNKPLTLV